VTTTYLASTARSTISAAFDAVNTHATLSNTGLCRTCQTEGPCDRRLEAERALRGWGLLPQRQPGATRPDLIGLRRVGATWFTPTTVAGSAKVGAVNKEPPAVPDLTQAVRT
jgi:hypothetical protein